MGYCKRGFARTIWTSNNKTFWVGHFLSNNSKSFTIIKNYPKKERIILQKHENGK
jgi:hypothetical protein